MRTRNRFPKGQRESRSELREDALPCSWIYSLVRSAAQGHSRIRPLHPLSAAASAKSRSRHGPEFPREREKWTRRAARWSTGEIRRRRAGGGRESSTGIPRSGRSAASSRYGRVTLPRREGRGMEPSASSLPLRLRRRRRVGVHGRGFGLHMSTDLSVRSRFGLPWMKLRAGAPKTMKVDGRRRGRASQPPR